MIGLTDERASERVRERLNGSADHINFLGFEDYVIVPFRFEVLTLSPNSNAD